MRLRKVAAPIEIAQIVTSAELDGLPCRPRAARVFFVERRMGIRERSAVSVRVEEVADGTRVCGRYSVPSHLIYLTSMT